MFGLPVMTFLVHWMTARALQRERQQITSKYLVAKSKSKSL
jgi:hypothetical protein